jgi:hypothetical protein
MIRDLEVKPKSKVCACPNGHAVHGTGCTHDGAILCASCNTGWYLKGNLCQTTTTVTTLTTTIAKTTLTTTFYTVKEAVQTMSKTTTPDMTTTTPNPVASAATRLKAMFTGAAPKKQYHSFSCTLPNTTSDACKEFPSAVSKPFGDILSLSDILRLADPQGRDGDVLLDSILKSGKTLRQEGGVLIVSVRYTNRQTFDPLAKAKERYVITSSLMPMSEFKHMHKYSEATQRTIHNVHGIYLQVDVSGELRTFTIRDLLLELTTALALLAASATVTDLIMLRLLNDKDKFNILKYQPTQHFSKLRDLQDAQKSDLQAKRKIYDERENKPCPQSDFLSDVLKDVDWSDPEALRYAMNVDALTEKAKAGDREWLLSSLAVAIRHEQRLNRLDALDENNLGKSSEERMAYFTAAWERWYWEKEGYGAAVINADGKGDGKNGKGSYSLLASPS